MCEGPEVFALAKALRDQGIDAQSYGTHIFFEHLAEDWGFTPRACNVVLTDDGTLCTSSPYGIFRSPVCSLPELATLNQLGADWMHATSDEILEAVTKWSKSRKPLGALLASQYNISGIGSAWGSEVCHCAYLLPHEPANEQDLSLLPKALAIVRAKAVAAYSEVLGATETPRTFIEEWPLNVQAARTGVMKVVGHGNPVGVYAYTWWV